MEKGFESLLFWQKAKDLAIRIYSIFNSSKDYGFKDQIQRAGISISNNIAEGFERQTDKELIYFLFIARGSCGEVRSMAIIGKELGYIKEKDFMEIKNLSLEISRMITGYIKKIQNSPGNL